MIPVTVNSVGFYVFVFLLAIVISTPVKDLKGKYFEHELRCQSFKCGDPRPRIFNVKDLFPNLTFVSPQQTLLHRCDESAGFCSYPKVCTVKKWENVTLVFMNATAREDFREMIALNHTLCSCGTRNTNPK